MVVAQRYVNRESTPIEAVYGFPLDEGAAVCGFEGDRTVERPDGDALNPSVAFEVPYGLTLSVTIVIDGGISGIESPSHPIALSITGENATVTLAQEDAALDRDFVLSVDAPALRAPLAVVERTDVGDEVIGVAFTPTFEAATVPAEIIFIVDRSGSMAGTSIVEARNALQLCLRSMIEGCRFNIIGFGTKLDLLFRSSRRYDKASLEAASAHVADMQADLGGTEILRALKAALSHVAEEGLPKQIVVLTDGEVTNTDEVIALARAYSAQARIFTFGVGVGVGAGAGHPLVRGLARAADGTTVRSVAALAARARIRELAESSEWLNTRGSRQVGRKGEGARRKIIRLSTRYGIISRETSYVAVERRDTPVAAVVATDRRTRIADRRLSRRPARASGRRPVRPPGVGNGPRAGVARRACDTVRAVPPWASGDRFPATATVSSRTRGDQEEIVRPGRMMGAEALSCVASPFSVGVF